jgi:hypothetical protein
VEVSWGTEVDGEGLISLTQAVSRPYKYIFKVSIGDIASSVSRRAASPIRSPLSSKG